MTERMPAAAAELDCIPQTVSDPYTIHWSDRTTHILEAVAALDVPSVAGTGGRKDGEGEENSDGSEASEHRE